MMIENVFELLVIASALIYSKFSRLPLMVIANILLYSCVSNFLESNWNVTITPGYEIYYVISGLYFAGTATVFAMIKDKIYLLISVILLTQALTSAIMLFYDGFYWWHSAINEHILIIECILVWLSSVRVRSAERYQ